MILVGYEFRLFKIGIMKFRYGTLYITMGLFHPLKKLEVYV